jgi:HPt (histidine-containing phosphotransfer) domain-containing protein
MELDKQKIMADLGIDEEMLKELLGDFLPDAETDIKNLEEALASDNFDEIAKLGHGLKGMAANIGITQMQDMAKTIEQLAKESKDKQKISENLESLKSALKELKNST